MGINNGNLFYPLFQRGVYNKNAKKINVYIDGECIRHKGKIAEKHSAQKPEEKKMKIGSEESIAIDAFHYMLGLYRKLTFKLSGQLKASNVFVYMDGERVANKIVRIPSEYDEKLIRSKFIEICQMNSFNVIELKYGESELMMYMDRDKTVDLNIFITTDSDLFSICYNHMPQFENNLGEYNFVSSTEHTEYSNAHFIEDYNMEYPLNLKVTDSCVWLSAKKTLDFISMDGVQHRIGMKPNVFHTFVALCGTDFTKHMLTKSMIQMILPKELTEKLNISSEDLNIMNSLSDVLEICVCFLYLTLKKTKIGLRKSKCQNNLAANEIDLINSVNSYINYINTGYMNEKNHRFNMYKIVQKLISNEPIDNKDLVIYLNRQSLCNVLENYRKYKVMWIK